MSVSGRVLLNLKRLKPLSNAPPQKRKLPQGDFVMKKLLIALTALALATPAFAQTIFECTTTNGKVLKLTETKDNVGYSFGKVNRPELAFKIGKENAIYRAYNGIGRYMDYSVEVQNHDAVYQVFTSADKHSQKVKSGVWVTLLGSEQHSEILCHPKKVRVNKLETIQNTTGIPSSP